MRGSDRSGASVPPVDRSTLLAAWYYAQYQFQSCVAENDEPVGGSDQLNFNHGTFLQLVSAFL